LLEAVGGFDSHMGAGTSLQSGEDTDVLIRASFLGFTGQYIPSIVVFHHHRRRLAHEVKKLYRGYAYGRGALSMKTVLRSETRSLYLKNWYWRIRALLKRGYFDHSMQEVLGAFQYIRIYRIEKHGRGNKSADDETAFEIWRFHDDGQAT
jgi:hypothetical protein